MGRMWLNVEETAKGYNFSAELKEVLNEKTNNSDYRKKLQK